MTIPEILSHPFILLIIGATLSSILVPAFSKKWQDRKKKLEIKIELITKISEVVANWELDVRSLLQKKKPPEERNPEWRVKGSSITAILFTYFPKEPIYEKWKKYFNIIDQFWWFSFMVFHNEMKNEYKKDLSVFQNFLGKDSKKFDWDLFFNIQSRDEVGKMASQWSELIDMLSSRHYEIVSSILNSKIKVF